MKSNSRGKPALHSAILKLQYVARKKRAQTIRNQPEKAALLQEARQLDEAVRLLRWIRK